MQNPILTLLTAAQWRRFLLIVLLTIVLAALELASIAGIGFLVQLATDPATIPHIPIAETLFNRLGLATAENRLVSVLLAVLGVVVVRNLLAGVVLWLRYRFVYGVKADLSVRLLRAYLAQPYEFFLRHNSAMMSKTILVETEKLTQYYLLSWVTLLSDGLMILATVGFLLVLQPVATLPAALVIGVLGLGTMLLLRRHMVDLGERQRRFDEDTFRTANEALGGIKEAKLLGREENFVAGFEKPAWGLARVMMGFMFFSEGPRHMLEIVAIAGFFTFAAVSLSQSGNMAEVAGMIGAFCFAAYRIIPAAHRLVAAAGGLNYNRPVAGAMAETLRQAAGAAIPEPRTPGPGGGDVSDAPDMPARMTVQRDFGLDRVSYSYGGENPIVIDNVTVRFARHESVGIVGRSGAGKSTLVDLLIGLLSPREGRLLVDGTPVAGASLAAWQRTIGYVPQVIYLLDASVRRNIALGVPERDIDDARIRQALSAARIADLVADMPEGIHSVIGESGVRLSGGQRQRIGIARALYHQASLLVLDEATSALDTQTESAVHHAIDALKGNIGLIIIAHRLATVRNCDRIIMLEAGRIVAEGDFQTLERENPHFRALLQSGEPT